MFAEILRVETYELVSLGGLQIDAVRSIISKEVRVFTISTVAEAGVGADLSLRLSQAHWVSLEVKDVALAALIVAQSTRPGLKLFFAERLNTVVLGLWAREQVHLTVVIHFEVEVKMVLPFAGQLWEEGLVTSVVTLEPFVALFLIVTPLRVDQDMQDKEEEAEGDQPPYHAQ